MKSRPTVVEIETFIAEWVGKELAVASDQIQPTSLLVDLGLSSREAVTLSGELEEWLNIEVSPVVLWEQPTIARLAAWLAHAPSEAPDAAAHR